MEELKSKIEAARAAKQNGGLSSPASVSVNNFLQGGRPLKGHFAKIYAAHWSSNTLIVSISQDTKMLVWDGLTGHKTQVFSLNSPFAMECAFERKNNKLVACGGLDNVCSIFELSEEIQPDKKAKKKLLGHDGYVGKMKFVGDSHMLTGSGDGTCKYWDIETGKDLITFEGGEDVSSLALSYKDEQVFVAGSVDSYSRLFDLREKNCIMTYGGHESDVDALDFFSNGMAFVSGSDDSTCRLFDIRAHQELNSFQSENVVGSVPSLALSSSGRLMINAMDSSLNVWDTLAKDSAPIHAGVGRRDGKISCVSIQPNGYALSASGWDSMIRVYSN